ncbi:hypothetical protein BDQ17DRAFT_232034 [Cyathus striatus]|nr:hypothetical protein BDQ17DRAFT_232034 [Cyathus striatus]
MWLSSASLIYLGCVFRLGGTSPHCLYNWSWKLSHPVGCFEPIGGLCICLWWHHLYLPWSSSAAGIRIASHTALLPPEIELGTFVCVSTLSADIVRLV